MMYRLFVISSMVLGVAGSAQGQDVKFESNTGGRVSVPKRVVKYQFLALEDLIDQVEDSACIPIDTDTTTLKLLIQSVGIIAYSTSNISQLLDVCKNLNLEQLIKLMAVANYVHNEPLLKIYGCFIGDCISKQLASSITDHHNWVPKSRESLELFARTAERYIPKDFVDELIAREVDLPIEYTMIPSVRWLVQTYKAVTEMVLAHGLVKDISRYIFYTLLIKELNAQKIALESVQGDRCLADRTLLQDQFGIFAGMPLGVQTHELIPLPLSMYVLNQLIRGVTEIHKAGLKAHSTQELASMRPEVSVNVNHERLIELLNAAHYVHNQPLTQTCAALVAFPLSRAIPIELFAKRSNEVFFALPKMYTPSEEHLKEYNDILSHYRVRPSPRCEELYMRLKELLITMGCVPDLLACMFHYVLLNKLKYTFAG